MKFKLALLLFSLCFMCCLVACSGKDQFGTEEMSDMPLKPIEDVTKYYEVSESLEHESDLFQMYYKTTITEQEYRIVEDALKVSPTKKLRNAQSYLIVLLHALQQTEYAELQIASAEVVPYALPEKNYEKGTPYRDAVIDLEANFGCDEYALQVTDTEGNEYLIWNSYVYERVFCNGESIYSYYHIIF